MLPTALNETTTVSAVRASSKHVERDDGQAHRARAGRVERRHHQQAAQHDDGGDDGGTDGDGEHHVARVRAEGVAEEDAFEFFGVDVVIGEDHDAERERRGEDDADRCVVAHALVGREQRP